jgi:hypothetical protein
VARNALAHRFQVLVPLQPDQRPVVHQDLAVHAEHVQQADILRADRLHVPLR